MYVATIVLGIRFNRTSELASRRVFYDFDCTYKKLLDRNKRAASLEEDLLFQKQMHRSELKTLKRSLKKMTEEGKGKLQRLKM